MEIIANQSDIRIDRYLKDHTEYSRQQIGKMVKCGAITVNGQKIKNSYKVQENDLIVLDDNFNETIKFEANEMPLDIVYEDNYLMIINKPSGLVVHPGSGNINNTLVNGLMYYTNHLSNLSGEFRPGIVHRIDKDTSGLLVVAKTNQTHKLLADYFKTKEVHRKYIALLNGVFPHNTATIDAPIGRDPSNREKMKVISTNSKKAITHLKVLKRYKENTLVELELETGRTHQIRVHMQYIGYPVFNDPIYSNKTEGNFGQFLHSSEMEFIHPITKENLHFTCPLPKEFADYLKTLDSNQ